MNASTKDKPLCKKIRFAVGLMFFPALFTISALAQEDVDQVADSAFPFPMRPPVAFHHDAHNEKAGIDDCTVCHHVYENGRKLEDSDSVDMECSECHLEKDRNRKIDLIRAYHRRCGGCHMHQQSGPIMCAECHKRPRP